MSQNNRSRRRAREIQRELALTLIRIPLRERLGFCCAPSACLGHFNELSFLLRKQQLSRFTPSNQPRLPFSIEI